MTLDELEAAIRDARSPKELFGGPDPSALHRSYSKVCHPDRNPGEARAERLFKELSKLWEESQNPPHVIKMKKHSYTVLKRLAVGDVSDVYLAESDAEWKPGKIELGTQEYVLKVSRVPEGPAMLENERKALAEVLTKAGDAHYRHYFPTFVETCPAKGGGRVNAFAKAPGSWFTLEQVHARHPNLDGRHLAWIFKRLLTALGFAHRCGWVNGAVTPEHVLVNADDHSLTLLGWGHSVKAGERVKSISAKWKDLYPLEVTGKRPATAGTDVFMAAKCMLHLSVNDFKDVPSTMRRFFKGCLMPGQLSRPDDAWKLLEEFDAMLLGVYGKPRFVRLQMA
jgi:serine/threonine protein kinase